MVNKGDLWSVLSYGISFKVARDSFGSNRMCHFFCQNLLFMAQAFRKRNNIRGSPCSIFQITGPNIGIFDLFKYGVNGKKVTCLHVIAFRKRF